MANIGSAYLTIFPSMDGFGAKLTSELNGINVSAIGDRLGDQIGDGISDGMGRAPPSRSTPSWPPPSTATATWR